MRSILSADQLDEALRLIYRSIGTDYPTDEQVKKLYKDMCIALYPPKGMSVITEQERQTAVLFRRALEKAHPFLLRDPDVILQEKRRTPADFVDIIHFTPRPQERMGRGVLILRRGKYDQMLPFFGDYPTPTFLPWGRSDPPLYTLLSNLLHRRGAIQYDTPIREFDGSYDKTGRLFCVPKGSATVLWAYLDEAR